MLKRDSLTAQMQQLSQVLAKVKHLIIEDNEPEAYRLTLSVFQDYFHLSEAELRLQSEEEFVTFLQDRGFVAEELNMLAYFIDEYAGLQEEFPQQLLLYQKLIRLFDFLEREWQYISFDHLARKTVLEEQLQKHISRS